MTNSEKNLKRLDTILSHREDQAMGDPMTVAGLASGIVGTLRKAADREEVLSDNMTAAIEEVISMTSGIEHHVRLMLSHSTPRSPNEPF